MILHLDYIHHLSMPKELKIYTVILLWVQMTQNSIMKFPTIQKILIEQNLNSVI